MTGELTEDQPQRDERGRLLPGHHMGRRKGPTHSEKLRALLEPEREKLVGRLLALTQSGEPHAAVQALRVAFQYLGPVPRPEGERVEIPGLSDALTIGDKARAVVHAVATGDCTPEAGEKILRMLDLVSRAVKLDDLERRLEAIERGGGPRVIDAETQPGADLV